MKHKAGHRMRYREGQILRPTKGDSTTGRIDFITENEEYAIIWADSPEEYMYYSEESLERIYSPTILCPHQLEEISEI